MDEDSQRVESSSDHPVEAYNAGAVGWLYRGVSLAGIVMAVGGVIAEVTLTGEMRNGLWPPAQLFGALLQGEPSAWTTLGIWILLAGPCLALVAMFITGIRRRSWPAVILAAVVLVIIALSIPVLSWIEGGV